MENTIQIVKQTSDGLVFNTKPLVDILDSNRNKKIKLVSITGKQNTGKSLLVNHIVKSLKRNESNKNSSYSANSSVGGDQTQASGIWMCSEPFKVTANDGSEVVLLLLETRLNFESNSYRECGIIFAISLLLSSTLIINIKDNITEDVLEFVENFSNFAQLMNGESKSDLFQRMVFLVRDWDNECAYRYGHHDNNTPIVNNYMKSMINPNTTDCAEGKSMRERLLACFDHISCYLMPNPGEYVKKPWFCGQIHLLGQEFRGKVQEFVAMIVRNIEPKTVDGQTITGQTLKLSLIKWQEMLSNHKFEKKSEFKVLDITGLELSFQNACDLYETKIQCCIESKPSDDELLNSHIIAEEECWKYFAVELNYSVSDECVNKMLDSLLATLANRFEFYRCKNSDRIVEEATQSTCIPCIARSVRPIDAVSQKPNNIVVLELPCPGSYNGSCDREDQYWFCFVCKELLEYGFDGYLYCECGRADVYSFEFKCSSKDHSTIFIKFIDNQLKRLLSKKEINILILGETGVGKSTWINGFVNYLTYPSLVEAKQNELLSLIASSFTITDTNYKRRVITCGEDKNEVFKTGQSATQDPKSYVFDCENKLIRIIDTPGIGDTRGIKQDKENFDSILRYLSNLDKLHGICILLKPNNARLGVMFRFCIKELLTHLHRDASRNIVFCFTNARSTFYRPGDTFPALESLLGENKDVEIELSKDTIYCMDNEPFRFLCALHNGIEFDEKECTNYSESWDKSVVETKRMLDYICGLTPHIVSNTLSLNDTRKVIVSLSKPMADITQNILTNISVVEDKRIEILNSEESEKGLKSKLYLDVIQLEANQLGYPRTVCTDQKCVTFHNIDGSSHYTTEFTTHCHPHCGLSGVKPESYPNPELIKCTAMRGNGSPCEKCGCSWEKHMHITYEQKQISKRVIDEAVDKLLRNKQTFREGIELQVKNMEQFVAELNDEKDTITKISAKFGGFLKANSIVPYNDALGEYLDVLIRMEKDKVSAGGDRKTLDGLQQMRKDYNEEVRLLELFMTTGGKSEQLTPIDVIVLVDKLYALKHKGKELKQIMQVVSASKAQIHKFQETNYRRRYTQKPTTFVSKSVDYFKSYLNWNYWK